MGKNTVTASCATLRSWHQDHTRQNSQLGNRTHSIIPSCHNVLPCTRHGVQSLKPDPQSRGQIYCASCREKIIAQSRGQICPIRSLHRVSKLVSWRAFHMCLTYRKDITLISCSHLPLPMTWSLFTLGNEVSAICWRFINQGRKKEGRGGGPHGGGRLT